MENQKLAQIKTLEELSLNALPCLQQILYDGWILRFADGYTKRANSVTPLYPGSQDLISKIRRCEKIYHGFNLQPIFRLTNIPQLKTLDQTLEQLGYQKQDKVSVQLKTIIESDILICEPGITIQNELSQEWLDYFVHAVDLPIEHWNTLSTMLEIIPNPICCAYLKNPHRFCSCGFGVLENDYLGLFFLVTAKKQRRQGYASQLISAMLNWGQSNGATKAYLQVEIDNQEGINLYRKLGFTEIYQYFYRLPQIHIS
ncbi:GCN5-related N-acetyltransferase [Hyella patelloides LEGE 07179]|uniref:GCN5-related N-acetyltransferase n=1 Tax=Hyella patelloides LEGE 07179 TaxID=945734 RepID=A0A563W131_9CYAN|nr:GNAT family N-acetyltransferase [Hyella patelloides]VEP17409.1 GCN5-related N-acetyltransferase [Hyella patelloides LEGE 07179]